MHRFVVSIVITLVVGLAVSAEGKTIHVKVGGTGDGSSWVHAYGSLQDALDNAEPNDDIWLAEGTYIPTQLYDPCDPRSATFQMKNGVGIYGGFSAVGDPNWESRDWEKYETVLSGDLLGNDVEVSDPCDLLGELSRSENCYHVFYHPEGINLDPNTVFDGFTVTGGNANEGEYWPDPGSIGGGMYNYESSPTVTNCTFINNSAVGRGGGICNWTGSNNTLINCTFASNWASSGGGMHDGGSNTIVTDCIFRDNSAKGGGGMSNRYNPTVRDSIFIGNSANTGGGMINYDFAKVTNCKFIGNSAFGDGGGMYNDCCGPSVTNCTFIGNSAYYGGGISAFFDWSTTMTNCTFVGNSARSGGGIHIDTDTYLTAAINCIFWENTATYKPQIWGSVAVTYSDIQGGYSGTGNINTAPLFIDPKGPDNIPGTEDDNLHLLPYSPCIDAGDPTGDYTNQTDIDGQDRVLYDNVDIGADEVFPIAGDIDQDGDVDFNDYAYFSGHWLKGK